MKKELMLATGLLLVAPTSSADDDNLDLACQNMKNAGEFQNQTSMAFDASIISHYRDTVPFVRGAPYIPDWTPQINNEYGRIAVQYCFDNPDKTFGEAAKKAYDTVLREHGHR